MRRIHVIVGLVLVCLVALASDMVTGQPTVKVLPPPITPEPTAVQDQTEPPRLPPMVPTQPVPPPLPAQTAPLPLPLPTQTQVPPVTLPPVAEPMPPEVQRPAADPQPPQTVGDRPAGVKDVPPDPEATQSNENPTGRQEPAVSIEWVGPPAVKLGQPALFQVVVKNVSANPIYQAVVRSRIPEGATIKGTEPKATPDADSLTWDVGTLQPQQERRLDVQLIPGIKGRLACQATVSFTGSSTVRLTVQEPKLVLKAAAPDKVLLGDTANMTLTVSNPGDGVADHVKVKAILSPGLEHTRGKEIEFELGNLGPNETRSVDVVCATKAAGEQKCEAVAMAEGGLTSQDAAVFAVLQPKLELAVNGPKLRYLDRQGTYVFRVTNSGNAPASNVTVTDQIPQGFKFVAANGGGREDFTTRTVSWFIGDLPPNQSREVNLQVVAVNIGEYKHTAAAKAARGLEADAETETRIEGLSAMLVELVDLEDPVEVGANARYEIRVTNTGSKTETNIQVVCTLPEKMEFWGAQGAGNCHHRVEGKEIIFDALPRLAPRADAIYRVNVRAKAPGDMRFRARIKADSLAEPVIKEESTRVYGDEVTPH
jgi:uncharacterized repeat protein (TIGR01451 family)